MAGDMPASKAFKKSSMDFAKAFIPTGAKQISKLAVNSDFQKLSTEWNTLVKSTLDNKDLPTSYNMFGKPVHNFAFLSKYRHGAAEKEVMKVMPRLTKKPKSLTINYNSLNGMTSTVPFTDKEQEFFDYNAGLIFTDIIENQLLNPDPKTKEEKMIAETYQNGDRLIKEGYLSKALGKARTEARKMLNSAGGKDSDYPKSEFYDGIQARGLDLLVKKFETHNRSEPLSVNTADAFKEAYNQLNNMTENNN